ncbi:phosphate ABC transporter substrate-binding protein [Shewanella polaris]|uniref:Phosphate ABC transporter substrate-binding protein n=1 Tax=Shewanella polaris TaxID=2588449 RepID=A0A4Y5YDS0_9GAMM|nr:phosphate ABC transporter substrate-binding protein [Shewanella polaris]QDE30787.1 phosphate ABC transporter substrate-binding protein [Shewanella polaris]
MMKQLMNKSVVFGVGLLVSVLTLNVSAEVAVVVNPSNESTVDIEAVKDIYLGNQKSFSDGNSALVLFQQGDAGEEFSTKLLERSSSQFKAYWAKRTFSGKGKPPKSISTSSEIKEMVASNPNAIGIIDAKEVDASIKVILLQ